MSSRLTKADLINLAENASIIAPSEVCEVSDTSLELTPPYNEYEGLNWDRIERY